MLGDVAVQFGDYDRALEELKRAIDLNGSDAESYGHLVAVLLYRGDIAGAIAAGELLAQFQPEIPDGTAFILGMAYILADRGADAVRILERVIDRNPEDLYANVMLAAAYAAVGRQQEAERQAERVRQRFPTFSRDRFGSALRDPSLRAKLDRALEEGRLVAGPAYGLLRSFAQFSVAFSTMLAVCARNTGTRLFRPENIELAVGDYPSLRISFVLCSARHGDRAKTLELRCIVVGIGDERGAMLGVS